VLIGGSVTVLKPVFLEGRKMSHIFNVITLGTYAVY
jgi:hypothetical protein